MLIESQAGEFEIDIKSFEREGDNLVMVGAMGVWEARTHITPGDAARLFGVLIKSRAVWAYVLTLPFKLLARTQTTGRKLT
jgi:hypothetical protein